jgi:hypothetical protein
VNRFVFQLRAFTKTISTVSGLEESPRFFVPVRGNIDGARVTRVDNDVIDEEPGATKVVKQLPRLTCIR